MKNFNTIDFNKLCFEFTDNKHLFVTSYFHKNWDNLMKVVDKIESIIFNENNSFNVTIGSTNYCVIQDSNGDIFECIKDEGKDKLETVVFAIWEFLLFYNSELNRKIKLNEKNT